MSLATPVAFIVFNRPRETREVFKVIKKIKPKKLYLIADGPRDLNDDDKVRCEKVQKIITEGIDWDCELITKIAKKNLGCRDNVSQGISWVFDNEENAIFLEDDCLPDLSFFSYAQELLERYKDDHRVVHISGVNQLSVFNNDYQDKFFNNTDYDFNSTPFIWGWASWRRAWKNYDVDLKKINKTNLKRILESTFLYKKSILNWLDVYQRLKKGEFKTWDYQWVFTSFMINSLCIVPKVNMVRNIGFNENATHINYENDQMSQLKTNSVKLPLKHPDSVCKNVPLNEELQLKVFEGNHWKRRLPRRIINFFLKIL